MWNNPSKIGFQVAFTFYMNHVLNKFSYVKINTHISVVIFCKEQRAGRPRNPEGRARSKLFTHTDADKMIHFTSPFQGLLMKKSLESVGSNGQEGTNQKPTHLFPLTTWRPNIGCRWQKRLLGHGTLQWVERPQIRWFWFRVSMDILEVQQSKMGSG